MRSVPALGALALVLCACGSQPTVVLRADPARHPYAGPMRLPVDHSDDATVAERSGAAGRALECAGAPYDGGGADYDGGLASTQDSPAKALANLFAEDAFWWQTPEEGYVLERQDDGRALLSYDVDGLTKVAFIAADDVRDWRKHTGWGIETWATCDPSELPPAASDAMNVGIWSDASGARVPATTIRSFQGPAHCGWDDITFLELGKEPTSEEYLRDTQGELADFLTMPSSMAVLLPKDAVDTGYHRDGRVLWTVPDKKAAYLVSQRDVDDVERWPAIAQPIGCD